MFHKLALAAALAVGGFAATAAPTAAPASAQLYIGVGGPHYGYGYRHRPYYRGYDRPYYRGYERPYYGYGRPRCRIVARRVWNGYRYVVREREVCGRRW